MRKRIAWGTLLGVAALAIMLAGCGGGQKSETATPEPAAEIAAEPAAETEQGYPLNWCIVSSEKLGSMGEPVSITHAGREIKFCCDGCVETFEASPVYYLARIDSAASGLIPSPKFAPEAEEEKEVTGHEGHDHG